MKRIMTLLLVLVSTWTSTAFGQTIYIQIFEGKICDTSTYAIMKAEKIQRMKNIFPNKDVKVTINDNLKLVRRTTDSLIYSYMWDIKISDPITKGGKFFEPTDYINKEFPIPNLTTLDNEKINIGNLKGKPTLINFWFTSCKPCIEEMPVLNKFKAQLKDSVNFVAITFEPTHKVRTFLKKHNFTYTHIVNAKEFIESMKMSVFPVNIFLDSNGIVRKVKHGIPYVFDENKKMKMGDGTEFLIALRELL